MKALILQNASHEGPGTIENYLKENKIPYTIVDLAKKGYKIPDASDYNALIVMGGPMNVYETDEFPYLIEEEKIIKKAIEKNYLVLGICLGAQMMAKALGANVTKGKTKEIGWYDISLTEDGLEDKALGLLGEKVRVFQWHGDAFEIPSGAVRLANSELFANQAFRYGKRAYALQFHLEVTEDIIKNWLKHGEEELKPLKGIIDPKKIVEDNKKYIHGFEERGRIFYKNLFKE
ncbi:MAG: type 1 glutamine amidotransferase [Nitrospirae bacterium]|nr:type 1 glutamine amidotransferase [Nitrospirota bacterium]